MTIEDRADVFQGGVQGCNISQSSPSRRSESWRRKQQFYPLFDYLRIVLALGVFGAHSDRFHLAPASLGNSCVQVFFALSGFLIGGILLESSPKNLPRFYFNRSTRIWIPYAIAIGLLLAATVLKQSLSDPKLWEFFFYKATFVYNWFGPPQLASSVNRMPLDGTGNHFWSICVEEQFYLLAPFVIVFLRRFLVFVLVGAVALNFVYPHDFTSISFGVLLALSRQQYGEWYLRPAGTLALGATLIAVPVLISSGCLDYSWGIAPTATAIVALLARRGAQTSMGAVVGGMSYPFYLNQWIGGFAGHAIEIRFHMSAPSAILAALAVNLWISWLHYRWVDSVIQANRSAWFTENRGVVACAIGILLATCGLIVGIATSKYPIR